MKKSLGLCALLVMALGCGDDGTSSNLDGGAGIDAGPNDPDASVNNADARVGPDATPNALMTFFVTSTCNGAAGGNLGGLSGADAKCQNLATNGGAGNRTWHAYLSTDSPLGNARDRIGTGPWVNQAGTMVASNLTTLHANGIAGPLILTELGQVVPGVPNLDHDILTGSGADGNLMSGKTCSNWTDSTDASGGQVGHADLSVEELGGESWNSQHDPQCSMAELNSTAGTGRTYCFAIN